MRCSATRRSRRIWARKNSARQRPRLRSFVTLPDPDTEAGWTRGAFAAIMRGMDAAPAKLVQSLGEGEVRLEPFDEQYRDGLRAACAADLDIWEIYPVSMIGEHFDASLERMLEFHRADRWVPLIALCRDEVVGMSSYIAPDGRNRVVEIGGTYIAPPMRGGPFNATMKRLMIDHALACGFTRIEFRVDTRNTRSMRALEKLGAVREGVLRKDRITWTGHVRDTAVFSILAEEWPNNP